MFTSEQSVTYEKKIGDVLYVIKSESLPDTKLDMVDAIIALIKRELKHGNKPGELLDRIEAGAKQDVDGVKKQEIRIVYRQFCYIEFGEMWDFPMTPGQRIAMIQLAV